MTASPLPWPDLTGAVDSEGRVCVGAAHHKSRSRGCRTVLRFYDPTSREEVEVLASKVRWKEHDGKTTAIFLDAIHAILVQKGVMPFDRGHFSARLIECRFYLMEACRGRLWPRYKWWLPYSLGWDDVLSMVVWYETLRPDAVVGEEDSRMCSEEIRTPHEDHDYASRPARCDEGHAKFVDDLLAARGIPRREGA